MTDKEIEQLDEILEKLCENGHFVDADTFREYPSGIIFGYKNKEEGEKYFESLAIEFENIGIATLNSSNLLFPVGKECVKFKKNGGFKTYYENIKKTEKENDKLKKLEIERQKIKDENDVLTNSALKYEETIRNQKQRILDLEEEIKVFSLLQKYWWVIGISIGIGIAVREFLF